MGRFWDKAAVGDRQCVGFDSSSLTRIVAAEPGTYDGVRDDNVKKGEWPAAVAGQRLRRKNACSKMIR